MIEPRPYLDWATLNWWSWPVEGPEFLCSKCSLVFTNPPLVIVQSPRHGCAAVFCDTCSRHYWATPEARSPKACSSED